MYIRVDAIPDSRKEVVTKLDDTKYKIAVKEPAQQNRANRRIQEILSDLFNVPTNQISMLTGHRSSRKMFSIEEKRITNVTIES